MRYTFLSDQVEQRHFMLDQTPTSTSQQADGLTNKSLVDPALQRLVQWLLGSPEAPRGVWDIRPTSVQRCSQDGPDILLLQSNKRSQPSAVISNYSSLLAELRVYTVRAMHTAGHYRLGVYHGGRTAPGDHGPWMP